MDRSFRIKCPTHNGRTLSSLGGDNRMFDQPDSKEGYLEPQVLELALVPVLVPALEPVLVQELVLVWEQELE